MPSLRMSPGSQFDIGTDALARFDGAPVPEVARADEHDEKANRKRLKAEARQRRDADRPPGSFERFRILMEVVNEGRQVVDLADHKARYALIILGALNAAVFFVLSRGHLIATLPQSTKPWLLGFLVMYAALTFIFVLYAIECLRPRQLRYTEGLPSQRGSTGVLYWEAIAMQDLETYRRAWSEVRMAQVNAEVVVIAHRLARLIRVKYAALGKLYAGLVVLVALAMTILAIYTGVALVV